jgi:hypothetical protein
MRRRILTALVIGLASAGLCWFLLPYQLFPAGDLSWPLNGARALLAGQNPYHTAVAPVPEIDSDPLLYPLPAVLLVLPLAPLPDGAALVLFSGISGALLAFALTRDGFEGLIVLLGVPFLNAIYIGQWSPLLSAAVLLPVLSGVFAAKPTLGAALWLARPSRLGLALGAGVLLVSLAVLPFWPLDWIANVRRGSHHQPPLLLLPIGPLLLLALLRWREERARLLLLMACVPQIFWFYDSLPLALVARSRRERLLLVFCSWAGLLAIGLNPWLLQTRTAQGVRWAELAVLLATYGPALLLVLGRPTPSVQPAVQPAPHDRAESLDSVGIDP